MSNFDPENFIYDLSEQLQSMEYYEVDQSFNSFVSIFNKVLQNYAPLRKRTKKEIKIKSKPWMTDIILRSIKKKTKLHKNYIRTRKLSDHNKYKKHCRILTRDIEKAKQKHYNNKIKHASKSSKLIWKTVNEIVDIKGKKENQLKNIQLGDNTTTSDQQEIVEILNKFFVSVGSSNNQLNLSFTPSYSHIPVQKNSFFLKPISIYELKSHIKAMNASKSVRPGDPPIKFIKIACDVIALLIG